MTKFWIMTSVAAAALAITGCGKKTAEDDAAVNAADVSETIAAPATAAQEFVDTAGASDMFEIETSKLAATNGASSSVKGFATKMITAHTMSTEKLTTAAAAATPSMTPNPVLTTAQQQKLEALRSAKGAAFDTLYITEQKSTHQTALATLRNYAASGDVPALKTFANDAAPTVAAHLNMANSLKP